MTGAVTQWVPRGPLSLLAASLLPVAGALAIETASVGSIALLFEVAALGWLVRDIRATVLRMAFGLVAAAGIAVTTYLYAGRDLTEAATAACRILYIVIPGALLLGLIRPSELGDHLAQRLHLPARGVVACTSVLQRLDAFGEEWRIIQRARRSRGLGSGGGPVKRLRESAGSAFSLLVVSLRRTGSMAVAMDARGFATATDRTWAEPAPWRWGDWLIVLIGLALAGLPWLLSSA